MESAILDTIQRASNSPGFATFVILAGLLIYIAFKSGVVVPKQVADLRVEIAIVRASDDACKLRCADLEKRIVALEAQNKALMGGA